MLRILITDDHALIRMGLKQLLISGFGSCVIGEAQNGREALEQVTTKPWDVVVLDITMPGRSGVDVLHDIKALQPKLPVLILSACSEDQFALRVLKVGAAGYLRKESAPEELIEAIKRVIHGHKYITSSLAEKLASSLHEGTQKLPHETLSDREYEVMCLIAKGRTPTQIAKSLTLSVKTISTYRSRILEKLHLSTNAELTYYAIKNGLVE
jgi:two-component system, NarL family, invasion response regulator UvrY